MISEPARRQIGRCRARLLAAGLAIEEVDESQWKVRSASDREVLYFPIEDRWRDGSKWGRGTVTLIALLTEGG